MEVGLKLIRPVMVVSRGVYQVEWKFRHFEEVEFRGVNWCVRRDGQKRVERGELI